MNTILKNLRELRLSEDEAKVYVELLRSPKTHLRVSRITGIDRSKVYRIVSDLEKRSLVARRTDDRGTFLTAADPSQLEIELVSREEAVRYQRQLYTSLIPMLSNLQESSDSKFALRSYEGYEGFKQMLWHELNAKNEVILYGNGALEDLVPEPRWAEKHRQIHLKAGYKVRELVNEKNKEHFTSQPEFLKLYSCRHIPRDIVALDSQVAVYNDTVSIYHWRKEQKVGVEIVNSAHAQMMRELFEKYWSAGTPLKLHLRVDDKQGRL